jgi:hypothetical protein
VGWPKAGVQTEDVVELLDQILSQREQLFVGG